MEISQKVVAFGYRAGASSKEGKNKGKAFVSFTAMDFKGQTFDVFQWNEDGRFPRRIETPCLLECSFDIVSGSDRITLDLVQIDRKSAAFDLGKVIESAKLPMEKA